MKFNILNKKKFIQDKSLKSSRLDSLLVEMKILAYVGYHFNIVHLYGCCTRFFTSDCIGYVFYELCNHGDLKTWLSRNRHLFVNGNDAKHSLFTRIRPQATSNALFIRMISTELNTNQNGDETTKRRQSNESFNTDDLICFAYQIAKGMEYLSSRQIIHCDLAARNILLTNHFECKISDFGLADKSKLSKQAFFGRVKTNLPIKWTAPEVLSDGRFFETSDA